MEKKVLKFEFTSYESNWSSKELRFNYTTHFEDGRSESYQEILHLNFDFDTEKCNSESMRHALEYLHILLGISYYKMYAPDTVEVPYELDPKQADVFNKLYSIGLGEFYYTNDLHYLDRKLFSSSTDNAELKSDVTLLTTALVQHGGGKDSLVSVEVVKKSNTQFELFSLNTSKLQEDVARAIGKDMTVVTRTLDGKMLQQSKDQSVYVGHVPVAAMYAGVSVVVALLKGHRYVVASNEASANYGNVSFDGHIINHQWDKSEEFEDMFNTYVSKYIHEDMRYFSLLRPLHEISIAKIFTQYQQYFTVFSSSNHHFLLDKSGTSKRWDVRYSKGKVEFVYALFSAILPKEQVLLVFEEDIYARDDVLDKFKELLGIKDIKPLECVGTPEETKAAMYLAYQTGDYSGTPVMSYFESEVLPTIQDPEKLVNEVFTYGDDSRIPMEFQSVLKSMYQSLI